MKRKNELSWMNVIFCAMVLWSHCSAQPISTLDHQTWQFLFVYLAQRLSFVSVYGFFLLSGVKLMLPRKRPDPPVLVYWKGRMKNIFLPYLLAVLIYYLWFVYIRLYFPFSVKELLGYVIRGDLSSPFYFLVALFQFVLLMPLLKKITRCCSPVLILIFSMGISWISSLYFQDMLRIYDPDISFLYGDRIFLTYLFYFMAGCCIGHNYDAFLKILEQNRPLIIGMFLFFTASDLFLSALHITEIRYVGFLGEFHFLYLTSAILFIYMVSVKITRGLPGWLAAFEKASFLIYLYHSLVIDAYDTFCELHFPNAGTGVLFICRILIVYVGCSLLCIGWQKGYAAVKSRLRPLSQH